MKPERIGGLALAVMLCLLSACQEGAPPPDPSPPSPEPPAQSQPAPEPPAQPGAESEPEPGAEAEPGAGAEAEPGAGAEAEPGAGAESEPGAGAESEPGATSEPEPGAEADPEPANTKLYVLMYHHFVPEGEGCNNWMLTDVRLREDLEWLDSHGYVTVLPGQLAAGEPLPEKAVMLTFDDGYDSNYTLAYPLLQEYQARAVISLIVRYTQEQTPGWLTWDMCREMARSGLVEFGSHTYDSHGESEEGIRRRKGESREEYEARVLPDLQASIDLIEENLGTAPVLFAYPNGVKEPWAAGFIQDRFAVTVTTRHGPSDIADGLYSLRRCNVSMGVPLSKILPS